MEDEENTKRSTTLPDFAEAASHGRRIEVDVEAYMHYLDDSDMDDDQKREMIGAFLAIVIGFVDLGFGLHPAQQACGKQKHKDETGGPNRRGTMVSSDETMPAG